MHVGHDVIMEYRENDFCEFDVTMFFNIVHQTHPKMYSNPKSCVLCSMLNIIMENFIVIKKNQIDNC